MINPSLNDSNRRFNVQFHCRVIPEQFCISLVVPMAVIKFNFPIFISFAITKKIIITIIRTFPVPRPNYFIILIKIPIEIVWCDVIVCLISWLLPGCWLLRVDNYGVRNWHVEMQPIVSHCCRFLSLRPLLPQTFLKHSEEKKNCLSPHGAVTHWPRRWPFNWQWPHIAAGPPPMEEIPFTFLFSFGEH